MYSLCRSKDGVVLAFCEIDNRPSNKINAAPRPYMCNLAVDRKSRGSGLAKDLVRIAEAQAKDWDQEQLYLKVKKENCVAVGLYSSLGYEVISEEIEETKGWTLLVMRKALHHDDEYLHLEDEAERKAEPIA
jgi:ribosomal protein S18 acetylase RimI-like enzyme